MTFEELLKKGKDGESGILPFCFAEASLDSGFRAFNMPPEIIFQNFRNMKFKVFFTESDSRKVFNVYVGNLNQEDYKGYRILSVKSNIGSWEVLESRIREEVEMLTELGFSIKYDGYVNEKNLIFYE